jgi:hypothetical protein
VNANASRPSGAYSNCTSHRGRDPFARAVEIIQGQPPVQSNIRQVVEFKFPPDDYGRNQERDYIRIAGSRSKFVPLGPAECGCGNDEPDGEKSTQRQSKSSSDMDELLGGSGGSLSSGAGSMPALPPLPPAPVIP